MFWNIFFHCYPTPRRAVNELSKSSWHFKSLYLHRSYSRRWLSRYNKQALGWAIHKSIPGRGRDTFFSLQIFQTDSLAHPVGAGVLSQRKRRPKREARHSPTQRAEVKELVELSLHEITARTLATLISLFGPEDWKNLQDGGLRRIMSSLWQSVIRKGVVGLTRACFGNNCVGTITWTPN